uniref:Sorcin n=1 Tax=Sciurus vulgaris TaxID=55149 RepID=A0A8D2D1U1_SCIVU
MVGHGLHRGLPGASSGYYPSGYGGAPGGPTLSGQTKDPLCGYFAAIAGQYEQTDANELQRCLPQSDVAGGYKPCNLVTCQLRVSVTDRDRFGTMGFDELKELWAEQMAGDSTSSRI